MSCEYEHPFERVIGWWNNDTPITSKACLCWGEKEPPDCPYFLDDNQKHCPRYKEKISE